MGFERYQHICKVGSDEVEDIEFGTCYIYPKIDGTNTSAWLEDGEIKVGSRNRVLSIDNDNQGACAVILNDPRIKKFFEKYPNIRLYGEFLVRHTITTYRDDAWRKFYIFDVINGTEDIENLAVPHYLTYEEYQPMLEEFGLDYVPLTQKIKNPEYENLLHCAQTNTFLIKDGQGVGEGIVIKRYDYINKYGRRTWAKIVLNEFKEKHKKVMGADELENKIFEDEIVQDFLTDEFIEKEYSKIKALEGGWRVQYIPRLLNTVYSEFIKDYTWDIVKKYKNPKIDYKRLQVYVFNRVKVVKEDLF